MSGWGSDPWGGPSWGSALAAVLRLAGAVAVRENVVQMRFSRPVYLSGLLDAYDASLPTRYAFTVVGGVGLDGSPARAVAAVSAALTPPDRLGEGVLYGAWVDVTLDRHLTPHPALYIVAAAGLATVDRSGLLDAASSTAQFQGAFRRVTEPSADAPTQNRDIANPQTQQALHEATGAVSEGFLATFVVGDDGDYAHDSGLTAYKKRVLRRVTSAVGGYAHLGSAYGAGVLQHGKRLGQAQVLAQMAAKCEEQVAREPETLAVRVRAVADNTGLVRLLIRARTRSGADVSLDVPFQIP